MGAVFSVFKKSEFNELIKQFDWKHWEEATPNEKDLDIFERVTHALKECDEILAQLESYKPRSDYIRKAMATPTPDNEYEAFEMVTQNAEIIYRFYKFGKTLEGIVPHLLRSLSLVVCEEEKQPLLLQQAIAKRLAEVFDFVLKFDELKMLRPGLQNDFSFYRRSLGKHAQDPNLLVKDDDASFISLFLAAHIPMMTALSKSASQAFQEDETITAAIGNFANACVILLKNRKFPADHPGNQLCLRAMVAAVILYDHVEPEGAFHKRSPILIKMICKMLTSDFMKTYPSVLQNPAELEKLKNSLKYSTMHFRDESTPDSIANMLDS